MKVLGKTILVTGAGSGMGAQLALQLVARGASVVATDRNAEALANVKQSCSDPARFLTYELDVTDVAGIAKVHTDLKTQGISIDGLINNAGIIQPFVHIKDLDRAAAERVMEINFWGPFNLVKAFLPELLQRPEGHILNIASMGAYAPVPGQTLYGASKAAVKLFTEGLRSELMETSVGVTVAFPGAVETNISANSGLEIPANSEHVANKFKAMSAVDAAKIMIDAIELNKPRVTVGKDAKSLDIMSRINPVFAANMIYKKMKELLG